MAAQAKSPDADEHFAALRDCRTRVAARLSPVLVARRVDCNRAHEGTDEQRAWPKIIHLVRHGEGTHNVMAQQHRAAGLPGSPYTTDTCPVDPRLTDTGAEQARALAPTLNHIVDTCIAQGEQLAVIVSPLRRATQTALLAFEAAGLDMMSKSDKVLPPVANEACREQLGLHRCDARDPRSVLQQDFPQVDYSLVASDQDPFADMDHREPHDQMAQRAHSFLLQLMQMPQRHVMVFTHSSFLLSLLFVAVNELSESAEAAGQLEASVVGGEAVVSSSTAGTNHASQQLRGPLVLGGWFATGELRSLALRAEMDLPSNDM